MKALTQATEKLLQPIIFQNGEYVEVSLDKDAKKFILNFNVSSSSVRRFINRLPECKAIAGLNSYLVGMTDTTAILLLTLWKDKIIFKDEETENIFKYLILTLKLQERNLDRIAAYQLNKENHGFNGLVDNRDFPLTPYQKLATVCALNTEAFAFHMEQGVGKTPPAISVLCNDALRLKAPRMYRCLIVAPKNVRTNWCDEIAKFKTCEGKVTIIRGTEFVRMRQLLDAMRPTNGEKFTAVIVSYEMMTRMLPLFGHIDWDLCIMDEVHNIASPITKRSKAAIILRDMCSRRIALTGTPVRNHALDLYAQLEFLGSGFSGFSNWQSFKRFYGVFESTGYGEKLIGIQNLPLIQERLARLSYKISRKEALPDLPDKVYDVVEVTMTADQIKAYKELSNTLMVKIESELMSAGVNREMVVQNILTQLLRLAQITSGFMNLDEVIDEHGNITHAKETIYFSPNSKLEVLVKLLKGDEEEGFPVKTATDKTIIWAVWIADILSIQSRLEKEGIKCVTYHGRMGDTARDQAVHDFNWDPDTKVFIGNPAAGGVGLNLIGYPPGHDTEFETNANHVIYYSSNWSQVQRSQSEDRACRRGTREPVRVTDLVVASSIDEEIRARVIAKRKLAFEISDIREIMKILYTNYLEEE